jgi:hypothetical protein
MEIKFKIKDQTYRIEDIRIRDYYEIASNLILNDLEQRYELVSKLSGCPLEDLVLMNAERWTEIWASLEVLIEKTLLKDVNVINKISHKGVEYGLVNFDDLTIGEFADLDIIVSSDNAHSRLHEILAVLYRPITKKRLFGFDVEEYELISYKERCQIFLDLPIKHAKAVMGFFLSFALASTGVTQTYLQLPKKEQKKMMEEIKRTLLIPGTQPSSILRVKTLLNSQELQGLGLEKLLTTLSGAITRIEKLNTPSNKSTINITA